jgi:hypothetical protein
VDFFDAAAVVRARAGRSCSCDRHLLVGRLAAPIIHGGSVNRKSIVQIFVLVLLVAVGAGVYLSQQEGGLDFMRELVGLGPGEPARTLPPKPVHKAAAPTPRPKPHVAAKSKPESSAIPDHLASGEIFKTAFAVESADIDNGVLTLRQGTEPLATEVTLFLRTKSWQVPAGRSFQFPNKTATDAEAPMVRVRWPQSGQKELSQRDFADDYTLELELGKVQDNKLPGKISLTLPDTDKSQIAGTFNAAVRGFHFVDGKPDLSSDSVDTLQYLALREILKDDPDMPVADVAFRQGRYSASPASGPETGYIEIQYRVGDGAPNERKYQFVKEQDQWRVARTLQPDQLDVAHPREIPGPKSAPEQLLPYLAAKHIESDAQKRHAGSLLVASEFATRYNAKKKIGVVDVGYKVGDGGPVQTAFLFRLDKKGWTLARELKKTERVNLATGKIEKQR